MDLGIKGKTALVTGGTSGIGYAIAKVLVDEGASVIVASRDERRVNDAVKSLGAKSGVVMDLTDEASIRRGWEKVGHADILLNNVGGPATGLPLELGLDAWDKGYASLVRSVLILAKLAVPGMKERKWGRILTVTSTSARELIPRLPISSTFRAGLSALVKEIAQEVGRSGILVNNLLPGPTQTDRLKHLATDSPVFFENMAKQTALGRIAEPRELGRVAAFLLSDANTFITGTDVLADGGYTRAL